MTGDWPTGPERLVRFSLTEQEPTTFRLQAYQPGAAGEADLDEVLTEFSKSDEVARIEVFDLDTGGWTDWNRP